MTTDREVWVGEASLLGEETVSYAREGRVICAARGFKGVTGSECWWYQARTVALPNYGSA